MCNSNIEECKLLKFAAYSTVLDGKISCESVTVNALEVIFIYICTESILCSMNSPFVIALNDGKPISNNVDVAALICVADNQSTIKNVKRVLTAVLFTSGEEYTTGIKESWQTAINMFQQSFRSRSISHDFVAAALDYTDQLQSSAYLFSYSSDFYKRAKALADRFRVEHASNFGYPELLKIMEEQTDEMHKSQNFEDSLPKSR